MKTLSFNMQSCCVCGSVNCYEATDHEKISLNQLNEIIMKSKKENSEIQHLKYSVKINFYKLKKQLIQLIKNKEKNIIKSINSFYFQHLQNQLNQKNFSIICDIFQNDFSQLPHKDVKKIAKKLQQQSVNKRNEVNVSISSVKEDIDEILRKIQISKIVQELNKSLNTQKLSSFYKPQNKLSKSTDSVKTCHSSTSSKTKQFQPQIFTPILTYEWKHIKITQNLKTLQLNNRGITDHDMIKQIPIISTFTNIKQLEIRNNKITALTCSLIANQMKFLSMIDMRGNKVGDEGIQKIISGMSNLKALYISQTGVTDKTGDLIASKLPNLQTLWAENNQLTGQSCIKISEKPKLRLLSLICNRISEQHKKTIQSIFRSKGYLNI